MNYFSNVFHSWIHRNSSPRHLTQSIALEESPMPGILQFSITLTGALITIFIIWSAFATIEEIATSTGQVIPSGYVQTVQNPDGGVVREILAEDGQLIEKNQPLLKFDATNANADLGQMKARQQALQLQASRLRAYTQNRSAGNKESLSANEQAILVSMEEARTRQKNVIRDQISQKEKELAALTASCMALEKSVALKKEEDNIYQQTYAKGAGSKLMSLTSKRELANLEGQLEEAISQKNRAKDAVSEAKNRLESLDADLKQEAMQNLGQVEAELAEVDKSIGKQQSAADRTIITAPVRGVVKGLAFHTEGAVAQAGQVLMEIVPVGEELIVESMVLPNDIGNLKPGQPVKVKVSAYDFSRYGSIPGKLEKISATTFQNDKDQSFYKAHIRLDRNYAGHDPERNLILPGMTVQADIITGRKTVLDYLLKPLHTVTSTAFHER